MGAVIKVKARSESWPHPTKLGRRRRIIVIRVGDHQITLTKKGARKLIRELLKVLVAEPERG